MGVARISVNVDEKVKKDAQNILNEIGLDLTTAIDTYLRAIIREERIPFLMQTEKSAREKAYQQYVLGELQASKKESQDPNTPLLNHEDFMQDWEMRREARRNAVDGD